MSNLPIDAPSNSDIVARPLKGHRRFLYIIIFEAETPLGRMFDVALLWAISISVLAVILESEPAITDYFGNGLFYLEWFLTIVFTIEYFLRLYVSKKPWTYMTSFFGLVDLLATLPTYLSLFLPGTQFLMVVRVLRLLRVFRVLKLVRFITAASVLGNALKQSRHKIYIFLGVIISIVLILGTCMYIVEGEHSGFASIPQSMYWTIVTMTTVGYGDIVPVTTLGKFVASVMMLIGYAIIAVPTGIVSAELSESYRHGPKTIPCKRCHESLNSNHNYCFKCGQKTNE